MVLAQLVLTSHVGLRICKNYYYDFLDNFRLIVITIFKVNLNIIFSATGPARPQ